MKKLLFLFLIILNTQHSFSQSGNTTTSLLLRVDDIGMNHAVNVAARELMETGLVFSASVMFACPWYQEAVEILKQYPQISVGVHLTLNSEWKNYRWGPVLGRETVPSLVDSVGYFYPSTAEFLAKNARLEEVERELSAQIERALGSGLKIDYVDYHMGTAVATPQLREVVEKLAAKYKLGISRYFGEVYQTMFDVPVEEKEKEFYKKLDNLQEGKINLLVIHAAEDHPEMKVLVDRNNNTMTSREGISLVSMHRKRELEMLRSVTFRELLKRRKLKLASYRNLISEKGLASMKRP